MLRRLLLITLIAGVLLVVGADVNTRHLADTPVFKFVVDTITVPDGDANEWTTTIPNLNGVIRQVTVTLNNNDNDVTTIIQIRDVNDSILWTETGIAENTQSVFQYNTRSSTDLPMALMVAGDVTIGITPSGDPGSSTLTADVIVWGL